MARIEGDAPLGDVLFFFGSSDFAQRDLERLSELFKERRVWTLAVDDVADSGARNPPSPGKIDWTQAALDEENTHLFGVDFAVKLCEFLCLHVHRNSLFQDSVNMSIGHFGFL